MCRESRAEGTFEWRAASAVGEKKRFGAELEKFLGRLPKSFMSCVDVAAGLFLKSLSGVYVPLLVPPSDLLNLRFIDQDVSTRHTMIKIATKAMTAPTTMKTKFSGRPLDLRYGACAFGGTVGGG